MKKIVMVFLGVLFLLSVAFPLYGEVITDVPGVSSKTLMVEIETVSPGLSAPVKDGVGEGTLSDDTGFKAENLPEKATTIQVIVVDETEQEAQNWIQSNVGGKGTAIYKTYHVTAEDENGNAVSHEGAKVTLQLPADFSGQSVTICFLDTDGTTKAISASVVNGKVSFTSTGAPYYVLCTTYKNPSTADRLIVPFCSMAAMSLSVLGLVLMLRRRQVQK